MLQSLEAGVDLADKNSGTRGGSPLVGRFTVGIHHASCFSVLKIPIYRISNRNFAVNCVIDVKICHIKEIIVYKPKAMINMTDEFDQ
jgi:hypothetical protein